MAIISHCLFVPFCHPMLPSCRRGGPLRLRPALHIPDRPSSGVDQTLLMSMSPYIHPTRHERVEAESNRSGIGRYQPRGQALQEVYIIASNACLRPLYRLVCLLWACAPFLFVSPVSVCLSSCMSSVLFLTLPIESSLVGFITCHLDRRPRIPYAVRLTLNIGSRHSHHTTAAYTTTTTIPVRFTAHFRMAPLTSNTPVPSPPPSAPISARLTSRTWIR